MHGDNGADNLNGGADADTFVFAGTVGDDTIKDFEIGVDTIDLTGYGPVSLEDALSVASQVGGDTVLDLGPNGSVTLEGINLADLSLDDFMFLIELAEKPVVPDILPDVGIVG